jgi:hypothetical protein
MKTTTIPPAQAPSTVPAARIARLSPRATAVACAALLTVFTALAFLGVRNRSATHDEPMHGVAALVLASYGDFRANPEDPPLWQHWAALLLPRDALALDFRHPAWNLILKDEVQRWGWCADTLYNTPGNDADAFLMRLRRMLVLLAIALGALAAWWGWQLGGAVGALVATALFAFDPTFLAHAPMIKNDVALSLVTCAMALAMWRAGRRLTGLSAAAVVVTIAAAPATKFSGLIFPFTAAALLLLRALLPQPWTCFGRTLDTRARRLLPAAALLLASGVATVAVLWACYDFRYNPAPGDAPPFDQRTLLRTTAEHDLVAAHPQRMPSALEVADWRPGAFVRCVVWTDDHRLLPQAFLHGLLQTYAGSRFRESFLGDRYSLVGFPEYFPLAFLFKTPLATLLAVFGAFALFATLRRTPAATTGSPEPVMNLWTLACLLGPSAVYFAVAIGSNLNIGVRHILPVYAPLFVFTGWAASAAVRRWGRRAATLAAALIVLLAAEVLFAAPNFLPFFNTACGGAGGGIHLLSDSNLDWGQDLPALARWQRENPSRRLYLCYFGVARPAYYGIRYIKMGGSSPWSTRGALEPNQMPDEPGVVAISATHLQGTYFSPADRQAFEPFRQATPTQILNGSIYLFDLAAPGK